MPEHRRPRERPGDPYDLPRQRRGVTPQMHGRYPDYDVLEQARHWDRETREVVMARVDDVPPIRFFTEREAVTLRAFCDTALAQDSDPRVPVLELVDAKLHAGALDGFQYVDMPHDRDVWRRVARGLDDAAAARGADSFGALGDEARCEVVDAFAHARLEGGVWEEMPVAKAWGVVMRMVLSAFYAHPWTWNEIGFGGPAYPRGYSRFGIGTRESWEGREAFELDPVKDVRERGLE